MANKVYDYKAFLEAYIQIPQYDPIHQDFRDYYENLVVALEKLFDVKLSSNHASQEWKYTDGYFQLLRVLFKNLIDVLQRKSVQGNFLEGGPHMALEGIQKQDMEQASVVINLFDETLNMEWEMTQKYRHLLYELFKLMYGKTDITFTSEDLLKVGFGDTKEPQLSNYHDYF